MAPSKIDFSTPLIPASTATFHASSRTIISAPASLVFRTLRNTETWKDWNRWCPRVAITDQPDDEDDATLAEIEELVRNTSIAVNMDSDITDGAVMPGAEHSEAYRRASEEVSRPPPESRESTSGGLEVPSRPAVTRQRLASNASHISGTSFDGPSRNNSTVNANGESQRRTSAAQQYQTNNDARRGSLPNSVLPSAPEPNADSNGNGVLLTSPNNPSHLMPAPPNTASTQAARRKSTASSRSRRQLNINALYGEPSVRLQLGTKMTLYMRNKLPSSQELSERSVIVTEVSRPDDALENEMSPAELGQAMIMRTQTHTDSNSGVYRLIWTSSTTYNAPKSYPKFLLFTQRVHEIRPSVDGAGQETCEYWHWEAQRGVMAKKNSKGKAYMEERMTEWGRRLGEFCESMGGAVERRDFVG